MILWKRLYYYFFTEQVLIPNSVYKGQKLITVVTKKIPPNTSNIVPAVPVTVLVKYNAAKIAATIILITLSAMPMFFFIYFFYGTTKLTCVQISICNLCHASGFTILIVQTNSVPFLQQVPIFRQILGLYQAETLLHCFCFDENQTGFRSSAPGIDF